MLQRLVDLVFAFREYLVLAACIVVSLVFLALNDTVQVRHLRTVTTVLLGTVQNSFRFVTSYIGLREENALLRRVNVELADEATQLREARLQNIRLRSLLELKERSPYRLVAAEVVAKSLSLQRNTLTLNIGQSDGVDALMPVVCDAGLVGVVTAASDHFSTVNVLVNAEFRASAKVQRSRVDGIVAWDGVDLRLLNVAKSLDVKVGDVVQTSGYSNTFPEDIRIGVVSSVTQQAGSLFKDIVLTPGVDFTRLEEVFVMDYHPSAERAGLEGKTK